MGKDAEKTTEVVCAHEGTQLRCVDIFEVVQQSETDARASRGQFTVYKMSVCAEDGRSWVLARRYSEVPLDRPPPGGVLPSCSLFALRATPPLACALASPRLGSSKGPQTCARRPVCAW